MIQDYIISSNVISYIISVQDKKLKSVQLKYPDGEVLFSDVSISINDENVDAEIVELEVENDRIQMILKVGDNIQVSYTSVLKGNSVSEHIYLMYKNVSRPKDFEFLWIADSSNIKIMPVPFGNHDEKPRILDQQNFHNKSVICEGAVLIRDQKGFAAAKKPDDRQPVWIKVKENNKKIAFAAASISANRGFSDESNNTDWNIVDFHTTQYLFFEGDIEHGFYEYRKYMIDCGIFNSRKL